MWEALQAPVQGVLMRWRGLDPVTARGDAALASGLACCAGTQALLRGKVLEGKGTSVRTVCGHVRVYWVPWVDVTVRWKCALRWIRFWCACFPACILAHRFAPSGRAMKSGERQTLHFNVSRRGARPSGRVQK